jgi:hypothetical protein
LNALRPAGILAGEAGKLEGAISVRPHALRSALVVATLMAGCHAHVSTAQEWMLRKHDAEHDIDVYERMRSDGQLEFRGVTHVVSRMAAFVALFRDVARMPEWVDNTAEVRVLEQISDTENYTQTLLDLPWPLRDRDAVMRVTMTQDEADDSLTIAAQSAAERIPPDERHVRMQSVESRWRFTPQADGRVAVEFAGYGDLGGKLAGKGWRNVTDSLVWTSPLRTLRNLQTVIGSAEYQDARIDFVREPRIWRGREAPVGAATGP